MSLNNIQIWFPNRKLVLPGKMQEDRGRIFTNLKSAIYSILPCIICDLNNIVNSLQLKTYAKMANQSTNVQLDAGNI
jgi:hypothetical protein